MNTKEWEIELEKLDLCECERNDTGKFQTELIKDFIRSLLSSYTQEIREKVVKLIVNTPDEVARLNGEAGIGNPIAEYAYNEAIGYEKAIKDVLQILESNE